MLHQNIVPLSTRFFSLKWPDESTTTPGNYRTIAWKVKKTKTKQSRQKDEFIKKKQINTGKLLQYYREKFKNNNNKKLTTTTTRNRAKGKTKQNKTKTSGGNKQQLGQIYKHREIIELSPGQ